MISNPVAIHPPGIWVMIKSTNLSSLPINGVSLQTNIWHLLSLDQAAAIASAQRASSMAGGVYSQYQVQTWQAPGV